MSGSGHVKALRAPHVVEQSTTRDVALPLIAAEAVIVQRVLNGERDEFRHLVLRYQDALVATVKRLVRRQEVAEDLAQQTFVDAFDALARFDSTRRFSTWLFRIGVNNAKDWLKSHKRGEQQLAGCVAGESAAFAGSLTAPDRAASLSEQSQRLRAALEILPAKFREVVLLKDVQGMSYNEIREILGHPITTLKIRAVRGRAALRRILDEDDRD